MGFSRNLKIVMGMVQVDAKLTASKVADAESDLTQVCTNGHEPKKPLWDPQCPSCGTVARDSLDKAREVSKGQYVVFTRDEVTALKSDDEKFKGILTLSAHDAVEVEGQVMPTGTVYYLEPGKGDRMYPLLKLMVEENPDVTYLGLYTVTSKASLYRVRPYGDVLVAEQLLFPEEIQAAPEIVLTEIPEAMVETVREVARKFITPFNASTYANSYRERLATAVSEREAAPIGTTTVVTSSPTRVDPMADMLAQMQAMLGPDAGAAPVADASAKPKRTRKPPVAKAS